MKTDDEKPDAPNSRLNIACFLLPILATFLPMPVEGSAGILGLLVSVLASFLAAYILIFRPSPKVKGAAWSYLFGFALAITVFVAVANAINAGQPSPWIQ